MTFFRTSLLFVISLCVALPSQLDAAKKPKPDFQIKFATLAPEGSTWMKTMHAIDEEVRAKTENRLGFKFYPGGVQGDEKDVLRKMRVGQIHSGGFTGFGLGTIVSEVRVLELPFMFQTLDEFDHLRDEVGPYLEQQYEDNGYIFLGWVDVGFIYLMSKNALRSPDDLSHAKMWIWSGDPLAELFFKAFDLSPIPLAAPDVLTSLQTGIIDAVYSPPLAAIALQWFTRVDYMTDVPVTHGLGAVLVTRRALGKVAVEDIEILKQAARPHLRSLTVKTREQNLEAIDEMKKEGVEIVPVDPALRDEFFTRGRAAWKDGVGSLYSQELLDRVTRILDGYRTNGR